MGYRGTEITAGVARQKPLGTGQPSVWTTTSSGISGIDDLYTVAGTNLANGDIGIIDTTGSPIIFYYADSIKNWVRTNPMHNVARQSFPEDAKSNGFRNQDASTVGWTTQNYSYSAPTHTMTSTGGVNGRLDTSDSLFTMTEVGFIILNKIKVATGATSTPIFDLRRDDGASPYPNLRLYVTGGNWAIQSSTGSVSTGVAYAQNTEYTFEIYYNYASNRCWVYQDYAYAFTSIANTSITLPTTTGTASGLLFQNLDGVLTTTGAAYGHLVTEL